MDTCRRSSTPWSLALTYFFIFLFDCWNKLRKTILGLLLGGKWTPYEWPSCWEGSEPRVSGHTRAFLKPRERSLYSFPLSGDTGGEELSDSFPWCERCLLITESPKTPGHYRYLIWVLCYIPYTGLAERLRGTPYCVWSAILSQSPISISLVYFQRNVVKETQRNGSMIEIWEQKNDTPNAAVQYAVHVYLEVAAFEAVSESEVTLQ